MSETTDMFEDSDEVWAGAEEEEYVLDKDDLPINTSCILGRIKTFSGA